jgi:hypothetical protein
MNTDITPEQKRMLEYIDDLHKKSISEKQKLAIEYNPIKKAKQTKLEVLSRQKRDNKIKLYDYYWA